MSEIRGQWVFDPDTGEWYPILWRENELAVGERNDSKD